MKSVQAHKNGFTLIETLIAISISTLILFFAYRIFFSQTRMVTQSIEYMQVNDGFRKVLSFMGDDIRESTTILKPVPVFNDKVIELATRPGVVMHLQSSELDPRIPFDSPFGGQIALRRQVIYELEKIENSESPAVPRYRLIRTAIIEEKPGQKQTQRQVLVDSVRDLVIYRTVRKPFKPANISSIDDRLVLPQPLSISGTGNSLVHLKMVVERPRKDYETGQVYNISMNTSFYKRGKEIFTNP
jgi:prepilin-type N-terminal cleavage/methylation domain-containing protein